MSADDHGSHSHAAPEEPKSPMWLPALGAFLFLLAGIWWMTRPSDAPPQSTTAAANAAPSAGAAQPEGAAAQAAAGEKIH